MGMPTASPNFLALPEGVEWVVFEVMLTPLSVITGPGRLLDSPLVWSFWRESVRFVFEPLFSHSELMLRKTVPWEFGALVSCSIVILSVDSPPRSSRESSVTMLVELGVKRD